MSVLLCAIETEKPEEITGGSHFSSDFPESSVQIPSPCLPYELKWRLTYSRLQSCFGMMKYRYTLEVFWGFFWKKQNVHCVRRKVWDLWAVHPQRTEHTPHGGLEESCEELGSGAQPASHPGCRDGCDCWRAEPGCRRTPRWTVTAS